MKNTIFTIILIIISVSVVLLPKKAKSAPPTSFKDTLSSSQLSYFARIGTGVSAGDSLIRVALSGNPSNNTNNLFVGDTIGIGTTGAGVGTSGPLTKYIITDIGNTALFSIRAIGSSVGIGQSNTFVGAAIVATRSAIHTLTFTPQSTIVGGFWEFLIKATVGTGETINDGIPDTNGFDLGQDVGATTTGLGTRLKVTDVTCPNWGTGTTTAYSIGTTTMPLAIGDTGSLFHVITCYLGVGGTNQIGVGYSAVIGRDLSTGSQLINPSPQDISQGAADVYTTYLRLRNATDIIDTVRGKIAMVEAVRVSATVDPTLTFTIDSTNVGSGSTACGHSGFSTNANNTTATQVAFGSLSLATSNDLAQRLSCTTNADNGYVVTVYEDGKMKNISDGTTIPDTTCPSNSCTTSSPALWTTYSASGWGYTIQNINVGTSLFHYTAGYKAFGDGVANAQQIMKNIAIPSTTETAYICYRLTASTTQEAGNYENKLIYTATATF